MANVDKGRAFLSSSRGCWRGQGRKELRKTSHNDANAPILTGSNSTGVLDLKELQGLSDKIEAEFEKELAALEKRIDTHLIRCLLGLGQPAV